MKLRCYSLFLSGALALLAGCKKDEKVEACLGSCTVIKGRLLTANGTVGISKVPLTVRWVNSGGLFSRETRKKAVATTGADGQYTLSFFIKEDELTQGYFKMEYVVNKNIYYDLRSEFTFDRLARDTTVVQDYLIPRKAYLKLAMTNPDAVGSDSFWSNFDSSCGTYFVAFSRFSRCGAAISWPLRGHTNPIEVAGDQPLIIENLKTKRGVRSVTYDTLVVAAGATASYTVTF